MKPQISDIGNDLLSFNPLANSLYDSVPGSIAGALGASYYMNQNLDIQASLMVVGGMYAADWLAMYGPAMLFGANSKGSYNQTKYDVRQAYFVAATLAGGVLAGVYLAGMDSMTAAKVSGASMLAMGLYIRFK